jgi:TRAP-type mannitol/chloroaromatic compound transport system permease small subunit
MPGAVIAFVQVVEKIARAVGLIAMYLVLVMLAILLYSSYTKAFAIPAAWTLEMAQFVMVAYYMLGGAYSLQQGAHVRMDVAWGRWSLKTRAMVDSVTILFLIFYLVMLLIGGISSTKYALEYSERSYSSWAPYMAPIKIIMVIGISLMLLQAIATFLRNLAEARGRPIP